MNRGRRKDAARRGQSLVEFALIAVVLVMTLIGVFEICRLALVYTAVANAAKTGVRYAIVHGTNSPIAISDIRSVVKNFLKAAPLDITQAGLNIDVTYQNGTCSSPGCWVDVAVTYPYDPLTGYFPLSVNLKSSSRGVITF